MNCRRWHLEVNESCGDNPRLTARKFMIASFERPQSQMYSGRGDRHAIRFQGVSSHSAIHSSLHSEPSWALLDFLYPSFFLFRLFLKSIEVISPKTRNDRGPSLTHANTLHLHTHLSLSHSFAAWFWHEAHIGLLVFPHPSNKMRENHFVIKSITRSWLKWFWFHCLPCEGGKH